MFVQFAKTSCVYVNVAYYIRFGFHNFRKEQHTEERWAACFFSLLLAHSATHPKYIHTYQRHTHTRNSIQHNRFKTAKAKLERKTQTQISFKFHVHRFYSGFSDANNNKFIEPNIFILAYTHTHVERDGREKKGETCSLTHIPSLATAISISNTPVLH